MPAFFRLRYCLPLLSAALLMSPPARADYFLHFDQMKDLLVTGEMTGEDGATYNIWIVPGYVGPMHNAAEGWRAAGQDWRDAGHDMTAYGNAKLYHDTAETAHDVLSFAAKDTIAEFALKGSAGAWPRNWETAQDRVNRRLFGWWFAYPWAVIEAAGENAVRVGLGVPGGVIIGSAGATLIPLGELAWPAAKGVYHGVIKGTYHFAVPGTILPVAAASWNTVITPPLAVLGQQPSASRTDGFWVTRYEHRAKRDPVEEQRNAEEENRKAERRNMLYSVLKQWGASVVAQPDVLAEDEHMRQITVNYNKERERLQALMDQQDSQEQAAQKAYESKRQQLILNHVQHEGLPPEIDKSELLQQIRTPGYNNFVANAMGTSMSHDEATQATNQVVTQLLDAEKISADKSSTEKNDTEKTSAENSETENKEAKASSPAPLRARDDKTDPLKRSIQLNLERLQHVQE